MLKSTEYDHNKLDPPPGETSLEKIAKFFGLPGEPVAAATELINQVFVQDFLEEFREGFVIPEREKAQATNQEHGPLPSFRAVQALIEADQYDA